MTHVKQIISTTVLGIVLLTAASCKQDPKKTETHAAESATATVQASPEFKDATVAETFTQYLQLKDALVQTDAAAAKKAAEGLASTTANDSIKSLATAIAAANDIAQQREQFSALTTTLKPVLVANLSAGEVYEQHCPMALNGGANWFAVEQQINNPYYGDKMLRCGLVQETLKL
ncbi:DUF3347 domain-containing protein [Formosa sediminum]|uniref:DUF3347 domain-containing protein n=1 Tax=Formosa sediminum TaxID=2594004 RepID=A0A516GRQ9_9FLAO|nr:DUF3347 domain-containing protein [Formosa sediminum]QDO94199.1 DUF3347 domain-containing protein [Formosa sediminum]